MAQIRVSPEQLRYIADQFSATAQLEKDVVTRLKATMEPLLSEWEGIQNQRVYDEWLLWLNSIERLNELLLSIAYQYRDISDRFAASDQQ